MPAGRILLYTASIGAIAMVVRSIAMGPLPMIVPAIALTAYVAIILIGVFFLRLGMFLDVMSRGPEGARGVALTFDDGPSPRSTPKILDMLDAAKAKATFFVIGRKAEKHPDLVREILRRGHAVAMHSYAHDRLFSLKSARYVRDDLKRACDVLHKITGDRPVLFRPPIGHSNPTIARVVKEMGLEVIGWSVRALDGVAAADPKQVAARVKRGLEDGAIILMHDAAEREDRTPASVAALPSILDAMAARNLQGVRVDDWILEAEPAVKRHAGPSCRNGSGGASMRIAQVLFSLDMGGQEMMALHLTKELLRRGHDVHVVSMSPGGTLRSEFAPAKIVDAPRKAESGIDPKAWPTMWKALRSIRPDVVHTHAPGPLLYGVPAARLAGVKRIVHTSHGANVTQLNAKSIALGRAIALLLTRFVPVSDETAVTAREREKIPSRLIEVIPNGIPLDRFSANDDTRARIRAELGIPADAFVVGTVGRVEAVKNHKLLVAAMSKIASPGIHTVIVGGGSLLEEVRASIPAEAKPFIHLTGPRRDVPDVLTAFDVFTLTSTTEGLPLAIPEAMATELPVVATEVGSLPTIVPKETGILVPSGDESALTAAYKRLSDNPRARKEMAKAARAFAHSRFSLAKMVDAYERIYREG